MVANLVGFRALGASEAHLRAAARSQLGVGVAPGWTCERGEGLDDRLEAAARSQLGVGVEPTPTFTQGSGAHLAGVTKR